jgi:5'-nucleotidase
MRILVTNDDSIHAEGIRVLEEIARSISDDVWVVAPEAEHSGAGHSLTMHEPLRLRQVDERHFAVLGTPTDSVLMAILQIMPKHKPDLILSGINWGMNVAEDVTYSGTIAAAMEGTLLEIPSIALSSALTVKDPSRQTPPQMGEPERMAHWDTPRRYAPDLIKKLLEIGWPAGNLININFPALLPDAVKGIRICPQGRRKIGEKLEKRHDPKGRAYYWIGGPSPDPYDDMPGADYMQLQKGYITVTPLQLDLTNYRALEEIREHFEVEKAA